jgi:hypothetical protein
VYGSKTFLKSQEICHFYWTRVNKLRRQTLSCATSVQMPLHGKGKKKKWSCEEFCSLGYTAL